MAYVQIPTESFKLLLVLKSKYPEYATLIDDIESNLTQRLWHQLSDNLITFSQIDELKQGSDLIELYSGLIMFTETAFNPMKLLILIQNILSNYSGRMDMALQFLMNIENKLIFKGEEVLFLQVLKGYCYLEMNKLYEVEDLLNGIRSQLEQKYEVDHFVYSNFYKLSTYYNEKRQNYDEFYNNAFQYLAYEKTISNQEKLQLCFKMCVASLIGEKMFNFAELIEKDFFKILINTQYEWIYNLILSFNSTKVDQFLSMLGKYQDQISSLQVLRDNLDFLQLKIRIAALLDLVFQKNKNERVILYKEIVNNCLVDQDKIEYVVIKALSLELIRGYIDEVENKVVVNWIQPKFLDREKIVILHDRLDQWIGKASKVLGNFQETSSPLNI